MNDEDGQASGSQAPEEESVYDDDLAATPPTRGRISRDQLSALGAGKTIEGLYIVRGGRGAVPGEGSVPEPGRQFSGRGPPRKGTPLTWPAACPVVLSHAQGRGPRPPIRNNT